MQIVRAPDAFGAWWSSRWRDYCSGGSVGGSGSTGARLEHNLTRMLDLLDRWVSENAAAAQLEQRP
jgi:hypothetical protein